MNLDKRVEQLEARAGTDDDFLLIVLSFVDCEPERLGQERAVNAPVIGYSAIGKDREWRLSEGESLEDVRGRIKREARAKGAAACVVSELR